MQKKISKKLNSHRFMMVLWVLVLVLLIPAVRIAINVAPFLNIKPVAAEQLDALSLDGYDKVMFVAHPDDETFWGSSALQRDDYLVVCITRGYDGTRSAEFNKVVSSTGDKALILSYPDKIGKKRSNWYFWKDDISDDIETILSYKNWTEVVTHNSDGEYGHQHHKMVHSMVTDVYDDLGLDCDYYNFAKYYSPSETIPSDVRLLSDDVYNRKMELVDEYSSQSYARGKFEHMFRDEDWIKVR